MQELIIGHFEKSISQADEARLADLLQESSEARSLYEQHRGIDAMMQNEAVTLAPSAQLDEAVIGAALGAVTQVIGSGAGIWGGLKIAAGISALLVGGAAVYMASSDADLTSSAAAPQTAVPPVVRTLPKNDAPVLAAPTIQLSPAESVTVSKPAAVAKSATVVSRRNERVHTRQPATTKPLILSRDPDATTRPQTTLKEGSK